MADDQSNQPEKVSWEAHAIAPQVQAVLEQREKLVKQAEECTDEGAETLVRDEIARLFDEANDLVEQADKADGFNGALMDSYLNYRIALTQARFDDEYNWEDHPIYETAHAMYFAIGEDREKATAALPEAGYEAELDRIDEGIDERYEALDEMIREADEEDGLDGKLVDSFFEFRQHQISLDMHFATRSFAKDFDLSKPVEEAVDEYLAKKKAEGGGT